jgi:hypothetical protein
MRRLSFLAAIVLAGCGPFIEVVRLDEAERLKVREQVRYYERGGVSNYELVQPIRATSCKQLLWGPGASQEDAVDQLRHKAAQLRANAVTNLACDSLESFSLSKGCWSAITCRADAIRVAPQ